MSKTEQSVNPFLVYILSMAEPIRILTVELEGDDGLIVTFSDGTTAGYVTEELLELRPFREPTESGIQGASGVEGARGSRQDWASSACVRGSI
jgi:hypothetical protein